MSEYPSSVITQDSKGNKEVRLLLDRGKFVRYRYLDSVTGKIAENEKMSILLKNTEGEEKHLYIIPLQPGRSLVIWPKGGEKSRSVWNSETGKEEALFD
ncbi:MAG: hypothetical protein V3U24_09880 [Candidatus Neomarinimicrobiota bacterium]